MVFIVIHRRLGDVLGFVLIGTQPSEHVTRIDGYSAARLVGDAMIFFNFVVIGVKLVLQGSTLPVLIRRLRVGKDWSLQEEELDYRESHP